MTRFYALVLFACSAFLETAANADVISYGSLMGANLFFNNISESSSSIPGQAPNLFGAPTVNGNMLIFTPQNFEASFVGGPGTELIDSQLSMTLVAKPNFLITGFQFSEFGDYTLSTPFAGGQASVGASLTAFASTLAGTSNGAVASNYSSAVPVGVFGQPWANALALGLAGGVPANSSNPVTLTLNDTLTAAAFSATDAAFIKKKGFKITVFTTAIPEPTSAVLLLVCGVVGMPLYRRR